MTGQMILQKRLVSAGLEPQDEEAVVIAELCDLDLAAPLPTVVEVRTVGDAKAVALWVEVNALVFGERYADVGRVLLRALENERPHVCASLPTRVASRSQQGVNAAIAPFRSTLANDPADPRAPRVRSAHNDAVVCSASSVWRIGVCHDEHIALLRRDALSEELPRIAGRRELQRNRRPRAPARGMAGTPQPTVVGD